jgi:hypothetical protein
MAAQGLLKFCGYGFWFAMCTCKEILYTHCKNRLWYQLGTSGEVYRTQNIFSVMSLL